MEFGELLEIVGEEPVFPSAVLLAGDVDPSDVRRQLSRWVKARRLYRLRRGVYALAPPYQRVKPHPFVVANALVSSSYVSLQAALAYKGLIPEYTPAVTSVTTARPGRWSTPLGEFVFRHIKTSWFHGYHLEQVAAGQRAFVARPEKALLDLDALARLTDESDSPKLIRTARRLAKLARSQAEEGETL